MGSQKVRHDWATFTSLHFKNKKIGFSYIRVAIGTSASAPSLRDIQSVLQGSDIGEGLLLWNHYDKWLIGHIAAAAAKSLQSCPTFCDAVDGSPPGSPVPGILQARTLEWVAISFSNARKWKRSRSVSDSSRPHGLQPTVHGIFQARVLEWGAIAFSDYLLGIVRVIPLNTLKILHTNL